jgi:hypothetical protein
MNYQLVLQFPGRSATDDGALVALEDALTAALDQVAEIDGHDVGNDAMNLFILTDDPAATFERVKALLERHEQLEWVTAAYRKVEEDRYVVIWPPGWRKEFHVA